jgi:signal transduction histidine kinase
MERFAVLRTWVDDMPLASRLAVHTMGGNMLATEWSFGSVLWTMIIFFFWVMAIWIFIAIFADIFRRNDLSGWAKAGWILLLFLVPFIGALIYVIARPKMTAQDREMMERAQETQRRVEGYSAADEIQKLATLRDQGKITAEEYEDMKRKAVMQI